jgi:hypothetical protein
MTTSERFNKKDIQYAYKFMIDGPYDGCSKEGKDHVFSFSAPVRGVLFTIWLRTRMENDKIWTYHISGQLGELQASGPCRSSGVDWLDRVSICGYINDSFFGEEEGA